MRSLMQRVNRLVLSLITVEFVSLAIVFWALATYNHSENIPSHDKLTVALAFACLTITAVFSIGAYQGSCLRSTRIMVPRILIAAFASAAFVSVIGPLAESPVASTVQVVTLAMGASLALLAIRTLGLRLQSLRQRLKPKVVVLGTGAAAAALWRSCGDRHGVRLHRFFELQEDAPHQGHDGLPAERLEPLPDDFVERMRDEHVEEIVVALDDLRCRLPAPSLLECRISGIRVTDHISFLERSTGRIDLRWARSSWLIFSEGFDNRPAQAWAKRGFDVVTSLILLAIFAPLLPLIAMAIALDSPGAILYRQQRVGMDGRLFWIVKFRTMRDGAERDGAPQWARVADPRITRAGGFLRRARLDEIPQLVNVLRGDMSMVGPRPERPEFVCELAAELPYYNERHKIRPGITGWAQINCEYGSTVDDARLKLSYDLFYLKNRSFGLDVLIMMRTVGTMLFGDGAR